jgi:hypothetical protein
MKFLKGAILTIIILTTAGLLFRGWLYRHFVTYKSLGIRTSYSATDEKLLEYINTNIDEQTKPNIEDIIKLGLSRTSKQLHFTADKNDIDPNKLVYSKTAHCVGYAAFFSTTCNYLFNKYKLSDTWIAKPQVGQLYFLGINMHKYFNTAFFKDHDFVTIENKINSETIAVDPTVNDYAGINFITYSK